MDATAQEAWRQFYESIGLTVIPLFGILNGGCRCRDGADCASPGKHPRNSYKRDGPGELKDGDNVGVLTDPLVVIDIDHDDIESVCFELDLPDTFTVRTMNGWHIWYLADPTRPVKSTTKILHKVDVRSIGGLVVAPPSRMVDGNRYAPAPPPHDCRTIRPIPPHVLDRLPERTPDSERLKIVQSEAPDTTPAILDDLLEEQLIKVLGATAGTRNSKLFEAACRISEYHAFGYVGNDAFAVLVTVAKQVGLHETEINNTIHSARQEVLSRS